MVKLRGWGMYCESPHKYSARVCVGVLGLVLSSSEDAVHVWICFEFDPSMYPVHRQAHFPGVP